MATISNIINTMFKSEGSEKVVGDTERVTKAQTRLGQTSVSASRQFAAQSSGLGGLVAAYAGAAATIFALSAAFEALAKAAQAENVVRGTNALAATTSQSGPRIIKSLQQITQGQLTVTEAAQNANIALSAGFNSSQIEQFATIAQKASRALGRDFTDSIQRIVRGVAKLEPELLDELGIFTRIEPAVQRYAKQLGISASSLNEFQRRQAFANATIEEGNRKFSMIDTSSDSLQKTLEQLRVRISELGTGFLQVVGSALAPFASFLTNDLGNSLLAFGVVLSLVFGKANELISSFINSTGTKLSGWTAGVADKAKIATSEIEKLRKVILSPISEAKGGGLSGIQTKAKAGQDPEQTKRFAEALNLQRTAATLVPSQLNMITQAYKEQIAALQQLGLTSSQSYKNLEAAIVRNNNLLATSGKRISTFIGLANAMNVVVGKLTTAFNMLGTAINWAFGIIGIVQLVGSLFDVDLLGEVINLFKDLSQASKDLSEGLNSVFLASAGGSAALSASLKDLGASDEMIKNVGNRMKELREQIESTAMSNVGLGGEITFMPASQETRIKAINEAIIQLQRTIRKGVTGRFFGTTAEDLEQAKVDLKLLEVILKAVSGGAEGATRVISQLSRATGIAGEEVVTLLAPELKNSTESIRLFGVSVEKVNGSFSLENATDQQKRLLEAVVLTRKGVIDLNKAIETGSVSMTSAGNAIAGLESQLLVLIDYYDKAVQSSARTMSADAAVQANAVLKAEIDTLKGQLAIYRSVEQGLITAENTFKNITDTFSKEISLFDTAEVTGLVNAYGQIAVTQDQVSNNQAAYLRNVIESTKYSKDIVGDQKLIDAYLTSINATETERAVILAKISKEADIYDKATAAVRGKLVDLTKQAYELASAYREITNNVQAQISDLNSQAELQPLKIKVDDLQVKQEAARSAAAFKEAMLQNEIQLIELKVDNKKIKPIEGAEQINTIKDQILAAQTAALTEQFNISDQILTAEQDLLLRETEIKQANIRAEAELQRSKIDSDLEVLTSAATVYSAIATQLETSLVDGGNAVGAAIVSAINSGVSSFVGSFGALGGLLGLSAKKATFAPVAAKGAKEVQGPVGRGSSDFTADALGMSDSSIQLAIALDKAKQSANLAKNSVTALEKAQLKGSANSYLAERAAIEKKRSLNKQAYEQEIALLLQKGAISKEEAAKRLADAAKSGGGGGKEELSALEKKLKAIFDAIKGNIENTLMSLNNLIFYGEGNFKDIASNFFKTLQQDIFKITIAEPLSNKLTESIFGMLGVKTMLGADNATVRLTAEGRALLVTIAGGANGLFPNVPDGTAKDNKDSLNAGLDSLTSGTTGLFGGFFDKITGFFKNLFGEGGILSRLFSGLVGDGGILSGLFKGILGLFGFGAAQGGIVHMAQGGTAISSALTRDRVPAMLEPGEFVLRKQAARKIGVPALQAMNATGTNPGIGNVAVNVTNEGSPKDAEASKPRFDGEKYVIDVVMRDISNNGPIRRSLRGRGGL